MTLATIMMMVVLLETVGIIILWWSRSHWWKYGAGRSVMSLLLVQAGILGLALLSRYLGYDFPFRDFIYSGIYLTLAVVMAVVGVTIYKAQQDDRKKPNSKEEKNG